MKKLPLEKLMKVAPIFEQLRECGQIIDETDMEMRRFFENAVPCEIDPEQILEYIEKTEKHFSFTQSIFDTLNQVNYDDPVILGVRELFANRIKNMPEKRKYWQDVLRSVLS